MRQDLRESLEQLRERAIRENRVEHDPIRTVLDYRRWEDREVVGLIAALLAYGKVELLLAHTRAVLEPLGEHPARNLRESVPGLGAGVCPQHTLVLYLTQCGSPLDGCRPRPGEARLFTIH